MVLSGNSTHPCSACFVIACVTHHTRSIVRVSYSMFVLATFLQHRSSASCTDTACIAPHAFAQLAHSIARAWCIDPACTHNHHIVVAVASKPAAAHSITHADLTTPPTLHSAVRIASPNRSLCSNCIETLQHTSEHKLIQ